MKVFKVYHHQSYSQDLSCGEIKSLQKLNTKKASYSGRAAKKKIIYDEGNYVLLGDNQYFKEHSIELLSQLPKKTLSVMAFLLKKAPVWFRIKPSHAKMAQWCNCCVSTLKTALKTLASLNLVTSLYDHRRPSDYFISHIFKDKKFYLKIRNILDDLLSGIYWKLKGKPKLATMSKSTVTNTYTSQKINSKTEKDLSYIAPASWGREAGPNNLAVSVQNLHDEAFPSHGHYCKQEQNSSLLPGSFLTERSEGSKNNFLNGIDENMLYWFAKELQEQAKPNVLSKKEDLECDEEEIQDGSKDFENYCHEFF